jgi:hypothetical protein
MKHLLLVICVLEHICSQGRTIDVSLLKFDKDYGKITWQCCNDSGTFYKGDTLIFTNQYSHCCSVVNFEINGDKVIAVYESYQCQEPPARSADFKGQQRTGKIKKVANDYFMLIYKGHKFWQKFKILELVSNKTDKASCDCMYMRLVKTP